MDKLTVVNRMLATMGEKGLNSLADAHAFKADALDMLESVSRKVQTRAWWFNTEKVTLTPSPIDDGIYLPTDCLSIRTTSAALVKRGNRIYNLDGGSYEFTTDQTINLIRLVEFEDLEETAADYISAMAVLQFQSDFDGDSRRREELMEEVRDTRMEIGRAHIRGQQANVIDSNVNLQRLKNTTRSARRFRRN